jgi:hypothetical protein
MSPKVRFSCNCPFQYPTYLLFDATSTLVDPSIAIKSILGDEGVNSELGPAFEKYNEEQFSTTKLPGGSSEVLVSPYNSLGDGRYYDVESQSSFAFEHATGKASAVQSYVLESTHDDLVYALHLFPVSFRALAIARRHYHQVELIGVVVQKEPCQKPKNTHHRTLPQS